MPLPVVPSLATDLPFARAADAIALVGRCEAAGAVGIGFGPCVGTVLPA